MTKPLPPASHASAVKQRLYLLDLPASDYLAVHKLQADMVESRLCGRTRDGIILVEHQPVFTLGNRGGKGNLKVTESFLNDRRIDLVSTKRGGDITYHGPGQLVAYPIVKLSSLGFTVPFYVDALEQVMIQTAKDFGIAASRNPHGRGVWLGGKKLGSLGISLRRGVSYHGLALNVCLDLTPFSWIHPCGLQQVAVTSLCEAAQTDISIAEAKNAMINAFKEIIGADIQPVSLPVRLHSRGQPPLELVQKLTTELLCH